MLAWEVFPGSASRGVRFGAAGGCRQSRTRYTRLMVKAIWEGTVLAETEDIVVVEGNSYFPAGALHREYFKPSSQTTFCPWKGTAHCYDVEVNGKRNAAAAWYYPEPSDAASNIRGRVAFWQGVEVE